MSFSLIQSVRRRFGQRRFYAHTGDWLMLLYNMALRRKLGKILPCRGAVVEVHLADTPDPLFVRLGSTDWLVLEEIFIHGEYEALSRLELSDVQQIVDLGANVGFSIRLWRTKFPAARIVAVEPDHANFLALRRNCAGDSALKVIEACVAGSTKSVRLDRTAGDWGIRIDNGEQCPSASDGTSTVNALTLGQILTDTGVNGEIDLLKCDIEGAERELFADCSTWIHRVKALIVEIHPPYTMEEFRADLEKAGSTLSVVASNKSQPVTLFCKRSP
jgi:FkbM family methyltransferase